MKSVIISIQPQWCELISSGKKTIEVRKTRPKLETPFKCYIYCTKAKEDRYILEWHENGFATRLDGKVIGEFVCDKVEKFIVASLFSDDIEKLACLSYTEMINYFYKPEELDGNTVKVGYAWHISYLKIYDEPKKLREFRKPCYYKSAFCLDEKCEYWGYSGCENFLTRPFQSWGYVEE